MYTKGNTLGPRAFIISETAQKALTIWAIFSHTYRCACMQSMSCNPMLDITEMPMQSKSFKYVFSGWSLTEASVAPTSTHLSRAADQSERSADTKSLVYLRMRRYKDSEQDASQAIAVCPSFIKRAMPYLIEGLHHANGDDGTQSDIVTFLTEIFALIPKAPRTDEEDVEIWYKVIAKLAAGHHWEGLGVVYGFYPNCQSVSLGTMLCELQDSAVKSWGEDLATCLIDNGASVDEIGQKNGIPTIHFVVKLSLRIKSLNLLNKVLDSLDEDKQNAQNADGNTALHILTILDKANSDIGLMVLECLLRCKCSTTIVNKYNKKPIDYLKEEDKAYPFLLNIEELKKDIEDLKNDGNNALKAKQYDKALKYYDDGIKISQKSKLLYKHAAILYSNCANGHWWHAKTLVTMGRMENAFTAYVDGFVKAEVNTDTKTQLIHCCNQLRFLDRELWPGILAKLSLVADWHSMAILIMGHGYDTKSRYGKKLIVETIEELCSGVAGSSNTRDVKCSTVFDFLGSCGEVKHVAHWLDATLLSVYFHGGQATFRSLYVSIKEILRLKDEGNIQFKKGQTQDAVHLYSEAINIFKNCGSQTAHTNFSQRDIAVLYGNRSEAFLKLQEFDLAYADAMDSVSFDGHWHKRHAWGVDLMRFLLECGSDRRTISLKIYQNSYHPSIHQNKPTNQGPEASLLLQAANQKEADSSLNIKAANRTSQKKHKPLSEDNVEDGYSRLAECLGQTHKSLRHENIAAKCVSSIVGKLAESHNPGFACSLSVVPVIRELSLLGAEDVKLQIVVNLLNSGASLGSDTVEVEHFRVVCELVKRGADISGMSVYKGDTPIHAATLIVLEKEKNLSMLEFLLDQYEESHEKYPHLDPEQSDKNGDCLFHLVTEALCRRTLSANYCNKDGKLPQHYIIKKNDRRLQFIRLATSVQPSREQTYLPKHQHKGNHSSSNLEELNDNSRPADRELSRETVPEVVKTVSVKEKRRKDIEGLIRLLPDSRHSVFSIDSSPSTKKGTIDGAGDSGNVGKAGKTDAGEDEMGSISEASAVKDTWEDELSSNSEIDDGTVLKANRYAEGNDAPSTKQSANSIDTLDDSADEDSFVSAYEELTSADTEVNNNGNVTRSNIACDNVVINTVDAVTEKGDHRFDTGKDGEFVDKAEEKLKVKTKDEKQAGVVSEQEGKGNDKNVVENVDTDIEEEQLVESDDEEEDQFIIDAQVFDNLEWEVECTAEVWKTLRDRHVTTELKQRIVHKIQLLASGDWQPHLCKKLRNVPATLNLFEAKFSKASSNDTEYHILKFYSFSSILVSHVLQNIETKVDFPFRVTDLEHAIINLESRAPILLLGRSGTGKTTCCMYRLWSQFHKYWMKAREADAPLLPRCVEFVHQEMVEILSEDEEEEPEEDSNTGRYESEGATARTSTPDPGVEPEDQMAEGDMSYDHLHQVFITKNAVLCNEVQKNFNELSHADDLMVEHVQHEDEALPPRLQDVEDYGFPMFVTSRQLLLMLDASIGQPYFFDRKEDGSLKVDIAGWTDLDGPLSFLPLLHEDSDAEDEAEEYIEEEEEVEEIQSGASGKKLKEIWPRIKKKAIYHPSLVWTEIMSFIKGSFEALSKPNGYLEKEEYFKLGRKRAPNFSEERDSIYSYFLKYEHFKKQNSLFDETDLVHDTFRRLRVLKWRPWVIHQIYVDETQDFTQAELCLLIRLCQNPNDMFLTGDTAQSIMRGISFRFSDLRSLFFQAKESMQAMGKTSAVEVPKQVYQLTHNYRSHAGILSLATSILELMVEFFPESFDRLQPDQGLFHGPQPILLESCSFGDLAVLLRGNRRKTSHIEFGAHQAILVVNDAARESIPEELRLGLVLTIYEAKGLEFDDVLLYNFFKDSQANKEWRVVTEYLERQLSQQTQTGARYVYDNLVQIDKDILAAPNRPRPLNFNPNQHKVLNSELKHLYTALTRARVNVWIFDEDDDKRAPMFEYFKARKLVKGLERGEDFMRHSLYTVAAKCFGMGGDHDRETASRLKDNPRKMRDEFLYAAELYLECNKPAKAALCLQNAKERELAAELFEKLGQFEKAAEIYRRMKQPRDSSRCYEQLGNFNKALDVLSENENYDMAIDTLRRAAELFHKYKNEDKMLEAVEKFQHVNDRVEFLRNRGYILQAAKIREANGDLDGAAKMLLMHGWLEEAILMARKTLDEHTIATCLLAKCRYLSHKQGKPETDLAALTSCFNAMAQEAADMFKACGDQDGLGCVLLLQADTSGEDVLISKALQAFQEAKPFENIAGSVACCEWLVNKGKLTEDETLKTVIKGIGHMFNLCIALMYPHRSANMERVRKYEQFYGLHPCSQDKVEIHPKERPLCLGMLPDLFKSKGDKSKRRLEVMKTAAHESVVEYLLKQTTLWLEPLWNKLEARREKVLECENYSMGMECEESGNVDNGCNKLHRAQTKDDFRLMIEADLMLIEFEATVQSGAIYFRKNCPVKLIPAVEEFIGEGERDFSWKYRAVTKLWEDLMPKGGHPFLIDYDSKQLLDHIVRNDKIQGHLRRYLQEKWVKAVKENRRLKCLAVRETDVFLVFQMGFYMFRLNFGREKLDRTPNAEMLKLENELDREISEKKKPIEFKGSMRFYSLMMDPDKYGNMNVQCIARRFADAYEHLISYNPYEAVFSYGKFVKLLLGKMGLDFHDIGLYIMWMEFYAVLAFLVIAKLKSQNFRNFLFVAPSHYISLLKFIGAMLPSHASNKSLVEIVHAWKPSYSQSRSGDGHMQERLKYIAFAVAGFGFREFKMMKILVERCQGEPTLYASIERLLILAMTLVCNISKTVPIENETSLMRMMCHANLPSDAPSRMHQSVRGLQDCNGIADVAGVLMNLLKVRGRGEEMLVCSWKGDRKKDPLEMVSVAASMDLFNSSFFKTEATLNAMWLQHQVEHQDQETMEGMPEVEEQQTEEELRQSRQEKQDQEQRELKIWAVNAIARWYRNIMEVRMSKDVKKPENQAMLSAIKIDETHCGICGVFFEQILKERLKLESSVVVGDESVLNETTVDGASKQRSFETANNPWEKEQEIKPISEEQRRQRMAGIHKAHKKQNSHSQKYQEFHRFKTDYNEVVEPQLKKIREFVYDSGVGLDKPQYVEQHYKRHKMEIERMLRLISQIEQEIHLQITSHRWAGAGRVGQNLTELMTDFQTVEPFDEEDRSRQASSASNGMTMQGRAMSENDDLEDIETVVEEPSVHVRKRDPKPRRKGKQRLHNR
ncbi:TRNK1-like protein [Mya arenaria]|uniref:TRNK1-like protein n=1 Tax=Mya arenaria TaxID=6604 RepID=A0ABY7G8K5_MYAAR|nr:TRNK1-like protein [Mya arenaria]